MNHEDILDVETGEGRSLPLATKNQRLANHIIDSVAALSICIGIMVLLAISGWMSFLERSWLIWIVLVFEVLVYYTLMEFLLGQTIGKMFTRTKVVKENGDSISFGDAWKRTWRRMFGSGFELNKVIDANNVTRHDELTGTRVIRL